MILRKKQPCPRIKVGYSRQIVQLLAAITGRGKLILQIQMRAEKILRGENHHISKNAILYHGQNQDLPVEVKMIEIILGKTAAHLRLSDVGDLNLIHLLPLLTGENETSQGLGKESKEVIQERVAERISTRDQDRGRGLENQGQHQEKNLEDQDQERSLEDHGQEIDPRKARVQAQEVMLREVDILSQI